MPAEQQPLIKATFTKPWRGFRPGDVVEVVAAFKDSPAMREYFAAPKPPKAKPKQSDK